MIEGASVTVVEDDQFFYFRLTSLLALGCIVNESMSVD